MVIRRRDSVAQENRKSSRRFFFFKRRKWAGGRRILQGGGAAFSPALPAAPKFRLRRVTLPLATNLGFCPAVADGGVAKGICLCLAECLECLCIKAVLSAAGSGWIGCDGWAERKRA